MHIVLTMSVLKNKSKESCILKSWFIETFKLGSSVQVILFEIDCSQFYTNLHELFCQFISWENWLNSGKFMDDCWISCQVMVDVKKVYNDLTIIHLYQARRKGMRNWN